MQGPGFTAQLINSSIEVWHHLGMRKTHTKTHSKTHTHTHEKQTFALKPYVLHTFYLPFEDLTCKTTMHNFWLEGHVTSEE